MNRLSILDILVLLCLGMGCGICLVIAQLPIFVILILAVVLVVAVLLFPKTVLTVLGIYLLFQGLIVSYVGKTSMFGLIFDRSEEVMIVLSFFLLSAKNLVSKKNMFFKSIDSYILLIMLIAITSSVRNHIVPFKNCLIDLFLLLKGFLVYIIFRNLCFTSKDIKTVMRAMLFIAITIFILGIFDFLSPDTFRRILHNSYFVNFRFGIPSVQSIFIHPGVFGWFMAFFACFAFAFFAVIGKKKYLIISLFFIFGSILSMRLKPFIGIIAAIFVSFILLSESKKIRIVFVSLMLFCAIFLSFGHEIKLLIENKIIVHIEASKHQNNARHLLYSTSFRIARDYFPLGSGLGTFGGFVSAIYYSPLYTQYHLESVYGLEKGGHFIMDTFWPYILGQFGFFGLICYCWILGLFFNSSVQALRYSTEKLLRSFILGTIMILVYSIAESLADPTFLRSPQYFYVFACIGITMSLKEPNLPSSGCC